MQELLALANDYGIPVEYELIRSINTVAQKERKRLGVVRTEAFRMLAAVLGDTGRDRDWIVYSGVHPNPVEDDVRQAAELFRRRDCDGVIAFGGGSPLDAGKAARLLVKRPETDFTRFYSEPADWSGLACPSRPCRQRATRRPRFMSTS